jgi:uncharacterized protein YgbK (DUF1537 family)
MNKKADEVLSQLPSEYNAELLPSIRQEFLKSEKTVVVFDDDPTGTQTCHDVFVLTSWKTPLIAEELRKKPSILFILTNSRSLPERAAVKLTEEIAENLKEAARQTEREIVAISRSDSTLRGHFPAEVSALARTLNIDDAIWILLPAFIEGGRYTISDVHYIVEQNELVPVSHTPFAKDKFFGYTHSNLKEWVEEKTRGKVKAPDVKSFSLEEIRQQGPDYIAEKLSTCNPGNIVVVNAVSYKDLEVFTMGLLMAEKSGQKFLFRSSATFVSIRAGIAPGKLYYPTKKDVDSRNGSLIVAGSYVPKTTSQLSYLLKQGKHEAIEINVQELLSSTDATAHAIVISKQVDRELAAGKDVVIYTSRQLEVGKDAEGSLKVNSIVSDFLVRIVSQLEIQPSFFIAKGGVTSSDLASKGLSAEKALILGQAIAGVPVWKLDERSKFSEILYIVFPGNVGGDSALWDVWYRIKYNI